MLSTEVRHRDCPFLYDTAQKLVSWRGRRAGETSNKGVGCTRALPRRKFQPTWSIFTQSKKFKLQPLWCASLSSWLPFEHCSIKIGSHNVEPVPNSVSLSFSHWCQLPICTRTCLGCVRHPFHPQKLLAAKSVRSSALITYRPWQKIQQKTHCIWTFGLTLNPTLIKINEDSNSLQWGRVVLSTGLEVIRRMCADIARRLWVQLGPMVTTSKMLFGMFSRTLTWKRFNVLALWCA